MISLTQILLGTPEEREMGWTHGEWVISLEILTFWEAVNSTQNISVLH